jgi:hypothetical protein
MTVGHRRDRHRGALAWDDRAFGVPAQGKQEILPDIRYLKSELSNRFELFDTEKDLSFRPNRNHPRLHSASLQMVKVRLSFLFPPDPACESSPPDSPSSTHPDIPNLTCHLETRASSPRGPGGAHLHFETWPGGRFTGGQATDPQTWLDGATEPDPDRRAAPTPNRDTSTSPSQDRAASAAAVPGAELPPLPASVEAHLQVDAVRLARAIAVNFPQINTIGGWRESDPFPDHPSGRAIDVMIDDYSSGEGKALGDSIVDYVMTHAADFHVKYVIWRQEYRSPDGASYVMDDRGGDTANHYDHVHISVLGGGYPNGSALTGPTEPSGRASSDECEAAAADSDGALAPGSVPPEFEPWYRRAGGLCPQISAALLAAQGKAESGFNPNAVSGSGAQGPAQFMRETWPSYGDDDGNGQASPFDVGDAIMGQGRYMCAIARKVDTWIDDGRVRAPNGRAEPPSTPNTPRPVDPDRIRNHHDHSSPTGCITTVTSSCSSPVVACSLCACR